LGSPSILTRHEAQDPARQKGPRGRWYLALRERSGRPAARSAEVTLSPARAGTRAPSTTMAQSGAKRGSGTRGKAEA